MTLRHGLALIVSIGLAASQAVSAATPPAHSEFLGNTALLVPAPRDPHALIYIKEGLNLGAYNKLLVDEIQYSYAEDSPYKGIRASDLDRISHSAFESLQKAVAGRFEIVDSPGPGVLHLRTAITGIRAAHKPKHLLSYTPVGLLKQGVEKATGSDIVLRGATAEVELLDSVSGERLIAVMDPYAGYKSEATDTASWKEVNRTLETWAQRLAQQIQGANGRQSTAATAESSERR